MNFRTTILLLVLLAIVGAAVLLSRQSSTEEASPAPANLLNIKSADVTGLACASDEGTRVVFAKTDGKWRITEPVNTPADDLAVGSLVDTVAALESRGRVEPSPATGLDQPRFRVEIKTSDGKVHKLEVGARSGAGDNLYVRRESQTQADVVPAALYEQLDKSVNQWRRQRLFDVTSSGDIKQLRIASTQQTIALEKHGNDWRIAQPTSMPADSIEAGDLATAVANLRATDFVSDAPEDLRRYGLDRPVLTVSFSTQPPATQPGAQESFSTASFGRFDDVMKKNVYAMTSESSGVVKVGAWTVDRFRRKPLELRDRKVLAIDEQHVTRIEIGIDKPATTQPTTQEAVKKTIVLERAKRVLGPPAPTTATTSPATTEASDEAATQPAEPPSKWIVTSNFDSEADDAKVESLLREVNPLRADRFLEAAPATQPAAQYALTIDTVDSRHVMALIDPGDSRPLVASYNGLTFELGRFVLEQLDADFINHSSPRTPVPADLRPRE